MPGIRKAVDRFPAGAKYRFSKCPDSLWGPPNLSSVTEDYNYPKVKWPERELTTDPHLGSIWRMVKAKKVKFALQHDIKAQQGSTGIALLVLSPRPQPWFDPRTIQSVASRYTDYAILAQ